MWVEYAAFGALVVPALVATFIGVRQRRAETIFDASQRQQQWLDGSTSSGNYDTIHLHHSGGFHDGGGSHSGGAFGASGGSDGGGGGHGH